MVAHLAVGFMFCGAGGARRGKIYVDVLQLVGFPSASPTDHMKASAGEGGNRDDNLPSLTFIIAVQIHTETTCAVTNDICC